MQVAPVGALQATIANMTTSMASQQQLAVNVAAQPGGNRMVGTMQEKEATAKSREAQRSVVEPQQMSVKTAQANVETPATSQAQPRSGEQEVPIVEQQLFQYLSESKEMSGAGGMTDPSMLAQKAFDSLGGAMEQFQKAFSGQSLLGTGETRMDAAAEAAPGEAPEQTAETSETGPQTAAASSEQLVEKMLQNYVSMSWAVFGASLASSSVSAATSSLNTLIKQQ